MENDKLNGFNNGRDRSDGIGGKRQINILCMIKPGDKVELISGHIVTVKKVEPYYFLCNEIKGYRPKTEITKIIEK